MDRRIVFFLVFIITVLSTLLVALVCLLTHQKWVDTVLYSLACMWIMGIVSQILLQNLYYAVIRPVEESWKQKVQQQQLPSVNLEDVEEIDQAQALLNSETAETKKPTSSKEVESPTMGVHVEQKG